MKRHHLLVCLFFFATLIHAASPPIDHDTFTAVLRKHVVHGRVNYASLRHDTRLDSYLSQVADTDPAALPDRASRLALWINAYNAYTLRLVADSYPIDSIHDLGTGGRIIGWLLNRSPWDIRFAIVGGRTMTLNEIEHEVLRRDFDEPRIHFAIVCAAVSCPPLRSEAYDPLRIEDQLNDQARRFLRDPRRNQFDVAAREARLSAIFSWFKADFGDDDATVLAFVAPFAPPSVAKSLTDRSAPWDLKYADYDWSLNDVK